MRCSLAEKGKKKMENETMIPFEEYTTEDLVDYCMEKFCVIEVCNALRCSHLCKEQNCPLYELLERVKERMC